MYAASIPAQAVGAGGSSSLAAIQANRYRSVPARRSHTVSSIAARVDACATP